MTIRFLDVLERIEAQTGLSGHEVAKVIDVRPSSYHELKSGRMTPSALTIQKTKEFTDRLLAARRGK